jgi:hypothetical protein
MANVWAIKSGDWSDTTVWNTGALPTSADDVYANNFNVNVNQNITVNSLRNTANTGITAGGTFTFNTGGITINITDNIYFNYTGTFIFVTASSGLITFNLLNNKLLFSKAGVNNTILINYSGNCDFTINSISIDGPSSGASTYTLLSKSSNGVLTINCNVNGQTNNGANGKVLNLTSPSENYINGNVNGGNTNIFNSSAVGVYNGANLTVNGNVNGGSNTIGGNSTIDFQSSGNLNIIGNVSGNVSRAIRAMGGFVNITGVITGGNAAAVPAVEILGTATLNHIGTAQASASASAITCNTPTTSVVTCTGPFLKNGYIVAIASQTLRINFGSNSYFQFMKSNGEDIDYVSTVEGYNYPLASDVRYGVEYKSGLVIGTCHVPTPDNVRKNIPVDNTVGTSDNVNAEDILEAIQNSTLPIAERLRNVATVESTGAQLEAYQ